MRKRIIASLLAASMVVTSLAGCSSNKKEDETSPSASADQTESTASSDTPLVVGYSEFNEKFSPLFSSTVSDQHASTITQVRMATYDRSGELVANAKDGQTVEYNGTEYTYYGLSNVTETYDQEKDTTTYDIQIRDDVKFSDGELLTADDLIFTFYVISDNAYDGGLTSFASTPIVGMKNYRANSTAADSITTEEVEAVVKEMPKELSDSIKSNIITPTLESEFTWAGTLYEDESYKDYTDQYKETKDLFAFFYNIDESYDSTKVDDEKQVVSDIIEMYGDDYQTLGQNYGGDATYFDEQVTELAESYVVEQKKNAGEGQDVPNIEGIKKISDTEVQITTNGYDATMIYQFDMDVAAMHYYGDTSLYDYDNNKFGFTRGDLSEVKKKTTTPMGAGPYKFVKFENKVIYYEANEDYYLGAPKIKYVQFKEVSDADKLSGLLQGTIDLSDPNASKTSFEQIQSENSNGELTGDKLVVNSVDNLGYGYIGLNATNVSVGGESDSDASKNLRKALATVLTVYRDVAIDTYYGDAASVIQYPISNTSWAAPQQSDSDYEAAYSKDVDGNAIYTDSMTAEEKYEAAKKAALGYLEAAGYTIENGKAVAAPNGAKLEYEALIAADGTGDHPSFSVLTDAKAALEELGITLTITDFADSSQLFTILDAGTQEIWCAAWQATADPDMYQIYHSDNIIGNGGGTDNHYEISDSELDEMIYAARQSADHAYRKTVYKQCLDTILDWGVEIPVYQRLNCIVYSPERINSESVTPDISPFYEWFKEIQNFEMM